MPGAFIHTAVWPQITRLIRVSDAPWFAAIAYFGKNADTLLPARSGSRLVVNASEAAVKAGQTHPPTLLRMLNAGVEIYSVANLHAKVVVAGRSAVVGSANASMHSANGLIEAAVLVSEPNTVAAARSFVTGLCQQQLTPKRLQQLAKLYRPPAFIGSAKKTVSGPVVSPLYIEQLSETDWAEGVTVLAAKGRPKAKEKRLHAGSAYRIDEYNVSGRCRLSPGDQVVQVSYEGASRVLVSPPGTVLHVEKARIGRATECIIYVEVPGQKRKHLAALAKKLGNGAKKRLQTDGRVRDVAFAKKLRQAFTL